MKMLRPLILMSVVFVFAGAAMASSLPVSNSNLDPNFGIKDPATCGVGCIKITSTTFSFTVPSTGSGQIEFQNDTGATLTSLTFDMFADLNVTLNNVTCTVGAFFSNCQITQLTSSNPSETEFQFNLFGLISPSGGPCHPDGDNDRDDHCGGIGNGQNFFFTFTSPTGQGGGWVGSQSVTVTATPEPGTLVLIGIGILPLWGLRKRIGLC